MNDNSPLVLVIAFAYLYIGLGFAIMSNTGREETIYGRIFMGWVKVFFWPVALALGMFRTKKEVAPPPKTLAELERELKEAQALLRELYTVSVWLRRCYDDETVPSPSTLRKTINDVEIYLARTRNYPAPREVEDKTDGA